jgi:uncharacterized protein
MMSVIQGTTNTAFSLNTRYAAGLSWWPVLLFLPARLVFSFIAQAIAAAWFALQGSTAPWQEAAGWWMVYLTIADILCLLALFWLTRREGMTLLDLVGVRGAALWKQFAWTPAYLLAVAPTAALASIITQLFYGSAMPPYLAMVELPLAGALYSVVIWPVLWAITEELVYLGFLLPRLEALTGRTWLAALVVIFFWALQHLAEPFIADGTYLFSRVLAAFFAVAGMTLVFVLWRRRLIPLIGVHWLIDMGTAFTIALLPHLRS